MRPAYCPGSKLKVAMLFDHLFMTHSFEPVVNRRPKLHAECLAQAAQLQGADVVRDLGQVDRLAMGDDIGPVEMTQAFAATRFAQRQQATEASIGRAGPWDRRVATCRRRGRGGRRSPWPLSGRVRCRRRCCGRPRPEPRRRAGPLEAARCRSTSGCGSCIMFSICSNVDAEESSSIPSRGGSASSLSWQSERDRARCASPLSPGRPKPGQMATAR